MKAMILAAGRGLRMGALTEKTPKPLLPVAGLSLIEHQIIRLRNNGFIDIVINVGYLGEKIRKALGTGKRYGVNLIYSIEPQAGLETGGGVFQALPLLGDAPFLLTNADVFCDYPYQQLRAKTPQSIHLVLIDNPDFKEKGDFSLQSDNEPSRLIQGVAFTFSGISVINSKIFSQCKAGFYPIAPLFYQAIAEQTATAEYYNGLWYDVGTPARLAVVEKLCQTGCSYLG